MSGIAGIIDFSADDALAGDDVFDHFCAPLVNNKSKIQKKFRDKGVQISVAAIDGQVANDKYISSMDGAIHIFINGHVFLSEDDARRLIRRYSLPAGIKDELLLPYLYFEKKENITGFLTGDFVVAVYDARQQHLMVFNSHFGMLPLYYALDKQKLMFSSRMQSFLEIGKNTLDVSGIYEYVVFNYPIGHRTFLEHVKLLEAGNVIKKTGNEKISIKRYWDPDKLFNNRLLSINDSLDAIDQTMSRVVRKMTQHLPVIFSALTGGWDGRLLLTYLAEHIDEVELFLFSFGRRGFKDITIPAELCQELGYQYFPVYLDKEFSENFEDWANELIALSDGLRSLPRTHYLYSAAEIGKHTDHFFSGNCASNLLKIATEPTPAFNSNIFKLINSSCMPDTAAEIYRNYAEQKLFRKLPSKEEFVEGIMDSEITGNPGDLKATRFYRYLLTNSERKYFGLEAASYSSLVYNFMPFIDYQFVSTIARTPFFGGHYKFADQSFFVRQKLIKLYAHLMVRRNHQIAEYVTDRGFPVTNFLSWQGLLKGLILKKLKYKKINSVSDPYCLKTGINQLFRKQKENSELFNPVSPEVLEINSETLKNIMTVNMWTVSNKDKL